MRKEQEDKIIEFWNKNKAYRKVKKARSKGKKFYFLDGPPYATGSIHIGTAWNKILKDCYIRFWRMRGFNVWDQPGYDTHGLPIENKVEKDMGIRSKSDIERIGMEKFILECRNFATKYIDVMSQQFADLGVWMDWSKPYLTLDNDYIEGAWFTFKIAYEKGLLYHGLYPVHVCPHCETAVAYNEIEYTKATDPSIFVKFPIKGEENIFLVIWTTTPWTLPANTGVMANPSADYVRIRIGNQELILAKELAEGVMKKAGLDYKVIETFKGSSLEGLKYEHPLSNIFTFQKNLKNAHRIVLSDQFVTLDVGTGLVHTAPGHGQEDYKVGIENKLPVVSPVKLNGTYNEDCGEFSGLFVKEADKNIIEELKKRSLLLHEEKITHDYPQCWRCSTPLLLISVPQWFFKVTAIRKKLIEENKKVNWYPEWAKQRFQNWLENLSDWPISRQRYWGIPLPIWGCDCGNVKVVGSRKELPKVPKDLHRPYIDNIRLKCKCGLMMKRIPDVLDVWFDSGLASWASLGYPKNKKLFNRLWPSDLQMEGPDQIRGWWNSELITSVITFNKSPFRNILFHGFVLDAHGIKMSKSKGNVVTPEDVVKKHGRDVFRFYLLSSPPWDDFYFKWIEVEDIAKSFTVIENTFNFIKTYADQRGSKFGLKTEDVWILSRLNSLIEESTKNLESYNAHKAASEISSFIINDFSRWYIKIIRDRVWPSYSGKDKEAAFYTLNEVAQTLARLMAPVCPFLSENISLNVLNEKKSVHLGKWPKANKKVINKEMERGMEIVKGVVETANAIRQENSIKLRWPLNEVMIECDDNIAQFSEIIKNMCNVKAVRFGKAEPLRDAKGVIRVKEFSYGKVKLDVALTDELKEEAMLREIIRKVQDMRKKAGLVVRDRIVLKIEGASEIKDFDMKIKDEVGAEKVLHENNEGETMVFENRQIRIEINKL